MVLEIRPAGSGSSDSNGGGFDPSVASPGTDYSKQDSPQIVYTDLVIGGTTTQLTSVGHPFTSDHVGNNIQITSGTNFTQAVYNIRSVSGSTATMDKSVGTAAASAGHGNLGGALATPGFAASLLVGGNDVWQKAGTYTVTSATANVAGGVVSITVSGSNANGGRWEGYNSTRGDKGTRPLIQLQASLTGSAVTIFAVSGNNNSVDNIAIDANTGNTTATGFAFSGTSIKGLRLKSSNCTVNGFITTGSAGGFLYRCEVTGYSGTAGLNLGFAQHAFYCEAHGGTCHGIQNNGGAGAHYQNCLSYGNTGATTDGFFANAQAYTADRCIAYGNGRSGFDVIGAAAVSVSFTGCVAYGNTGEGFHATAVTDGVYLLGCAGGGNSANYNTTDIKDSGSSVNVEGFVVLGADPFTAGSSGDFSLNTTTNGGALLAATGIPATSPSGLTLSYPDIGFAQHKDPVGGTKSGQRRRGR